MTMLDYKRIEKLKEKYRVIRDQKIRERVEALGLKSKEMRIEKHYYKKKKIIQTQDKK